MEYVIADISTAPYELRMFVLKLRFQFWLENDCELSLI